jgi:hypothetical protein
MMAFTWMEREREKWNDGGERKVFIYSRELYQKTFLLSPPLPVKDMKMEIKAIERTRKIKKMDENDSC